jgi:pseudaminic acid biosynthesis-associated methylase
MKKEWKEKFGFDYTNRCLPSAEDIHNRTFLFKRVLHNIEHLHGPMSVFEVGCNVGQNLMAIKSAMRILDPDQVVNVGACEPNEYARSIAKSQCDVFADEAKDLDPAVHGMYDIVLCAGVLIHVPPDEISEVVDKVTALSRRYIILVEYFAPKERMVKYRGHDNMMWLRDYGSLFLDANPDLKLVDYGFAWKRDTGMDNVTWWVLEKCK